MAILGRDTSTPTHWLKTGLAHSRRVGKIHGESAIGTGFAIDGSFFAENLSGQPLFVTATHCFRQQSEGASPYTPTIEEASVVFEGMFEDSTESIVCRFQQAIWQSSVDDLNVSLLLLDRFPGEFPIIDIAPSLPEPGDRVYVVGYPLGNTLSVSLIDNEVIGHDRSRLLYRAPTQPGSSGSLVFNDHWEAVAVHIGGGRNIRWHDSNIAANWATDLKQVANAALPQLIDIRLPPPVKKPSSQLDDDFFSVFISYSHSDAAFARRLYNELVNHGIRCWLDEHQVLPGDDIYEQVNAGIRDWDKVLLCCSQSSLTSWWVDNEIDEAFQKERRLMKERQRKILALIPLNIDGYLFKGWESGKAQQVKSRLAADFTGWTQEEAKFREALNKLVMALKTSGGREAPPLPKL